MGTRSVRRRALTLFVPAGALALIAALTVAPGSVASARPSTQAAAVTTTQSTRSLARGASLGSLADGVGHLPAGTRGGETPPGEAEPDAGAVARSASTRGLVNRSYSPRP